MLILFDIDATLLSTSGAGMRAMEAAGRELFGERCRADGISFAGRLDPLIMRDMLVNAGVAPSRENLALFRGGYERHMGAWYRNARSGQAMPGVLPLLESLDAIDGLTLGLLTGNFEPTGLLKLRAVGIGTERFTINAWGDDSPHDPPERTHLPPVAVGRYRQKKGRDPKKVVIIGDTPHDVGCAKAHGHRAIGVATGKFSVDELAKSGADHVFADLSPTDEVVRRLLSG